MSKLRREVSSKNIRLGAKNPILVQTMLKRNFFDYSPEYLENLRYRGCDILRFSLNRESDKNALRKFISSSPIPLVLDIKVEKGEAIFALDNGIDAVRINPALLQEAAIREIFAAAKNNASLVRIGTNEGSIRGEDALRLIEETINIAESMGFQNIVTSVKASCLDTTLALNKELAKRTAYPIHVGLTEAGGVIESAVRSTVAMADLLSKGIGDTIRYSMAGPESAEVIAGVELLSSLKLRQPFLNMIICPSCARATFLTEEFLKEVEDELYKITYMNKKPITVAIMGCPLNGIGEATSADVGISGSGDDIVIFKAGKVVDKCKKKDAIRLLLSVINNY